jgi:Mg-chelatase subunit ChlD/PKD repeat protein
MNNLYGRKLSIFLMSLFIVTSIGIVGHQQGVTTLDIEQSLEKERIFAQGTGVDPRETTVTLELTAPGRVQRVQADIVLVVDRSASFPLDKAVEAANSILDQLRPDDRIGLVSFGSDVTRDADLTYSDNADSVREALDDLRAEGRTELGIGMAVATDHLVFDRDSREDAELIQILLTDGRFTPGTRSPLEEANTARDQGVLVYAIGIGTSVNRELLEQVSEETGGKFFLTYSNSIVDEILRVSVSSRDPVVTDIEITEILNQEFEFERALENPPNSVIPNNDGTTTLRWSVNSLEPEEQWKTEYAVSGREVGQFELHTDDSNVSYRDIRGRLLDPDLPDLTIDVRPTPPAVDANFSFEPQDPSTFDFIAFSDESTLEEGRIVEWFWEFGDEADEEDQSSSSDRSPTFKYEEDGSYEVTLTVTSDEGAQAVFIQRIDVSTPMVSVRRTIETYIPDDETLPGQTFQVTLDIRLNERVNGFGVDEDIPNQWTISSIEYTNATPNYLAGEDQWLFHDIYEEGTQITIVYDVSVPLTTQVTQPTTDADGQPILDDNGNQVPPIIDEDLIPLNVLSADYSFEGKVTSASPTIDEFVVGERNVKISRGLPIEEVVAHYNVAGNGRLDLKGNPDHIIDEEQWALAKQWWERKQSVPNSNDAADTPQLIDFEKMNELTAYYLTQTSVYDELPELE